MDKFVDKIITYMFKDEIIQEDDKTIYIFGIQQGLIIILNILSSVIIGLVFERLLYSILFLILYIPLRSFAGGFHARTLLRCYLYSVLINIAAILLLGYLVNKNNLLLIILLSFFIFLLSPVDSENKRFDDDEKRTYKNKTALILLILNILNLSAFFIRIHTISAGVLVTLIIMIFMLIIGIISNIYNQCFHHQKE